MKYEIWIIGDETEHLMTFYCGDSALKFIYEKGYKLYSVYYGGYDRMIFEVKEIDD